MEEFTHVRTENTRLREQVEGLARQENRLSTAPSGIQDDGRWSRVSTTKATLFEPPPLVQAQGTALAPSLILPIKTFDQDSGPDANV